MIHTFNLIAGRNEYSNFDISFRKIIFNTIYLFTRSMPIRIHSIIIDKKYVDRLNVLKYELIQLVINKNDYFKNFDLIVLYYDKGQESLGKMLDNTFNKFNDYKHIILFDHTKKKLFQVADMLTFIDKYDYKYKNKIKINSNERYFFTEDEVKKILKSINKKRL